MGGTPRVTYLLPRRVDTNVGCQRYFVLALEQVAATRIRPEPPWAWPFRRQEQKVRAIHQMRLLFDRSGFRALQAVPATGLTGRYLAEIDGRQVRFAIDGRDGPALLDPEILDWSDVYFKANRWPGVEYPDKVLPLINGNGRIDEARIALLRRLRTREKDIDVCFVSNVWGGREHNVRLFEQLGRVGGRKVLRAVFPGGFPEAETAELKLRLGRAGVPSGDVQMPLPELWETMARSKVVFFRSGKHLCLPWRTLDLLAMGACVVMDAVPTPEWYVPLQRDVNYVACLDARPSDTSPAPDEEYERIAPVVSALLADPSRTESIGLSNARYFDEHVAPAPLGAHILRTLRERSGAGAGDGPDPATR